MSFDCQPHWFLNALWRTVAAICVIYRSTLLIVSPWMLVCANYSHTNQSVHWGELQSDQNLQIKEMAREDQDEARKLQRLERAMNELGNCIEHEKLRLKWDTHLRQPSHMWNRVSTQYLIRCAGPAKHNRENGRNLSAIPCTTGPLTRLIGTHMIHETTLSL